MKHSAEYRSDIDITMLKDSDYVQCSRGEVNPTKMLGFFCVFIAAGTGYRAQHVEEGEELVMSVIKWPDQYYWSPSLVVGKSVIMIDEFAKLTMVPSEDDVSFLDAKEYILLKPNAGKYGPPCTYS